MRGLTFVRMPHNGPHFINPLNKLAKTSKGCVTTPNTTYFVGRRSRSEGTGVSIVMSVYL